MGDTSGRGELELVDDGREDLARELVETGIVRDRRAPLEQERVVETRERELELGTRRRLDDDARELVDCDPQILDVVDVEPEPRRDRRRRQARHPDVLQRRRQRQPHDFGRCRAVRSYLGFHGDPLVGDRDAVRDRDRTKLAEPAASRPCGARRAHRPFRRRRMRVHPRLERHRGARDGNSPVDDDTAAAQDLVLHMDQHGDAAVVQVTGELDAFTAPDLATLCNEMCQLGVRDAVLDLRGTTFLDSSGLRVLVGAHDLFTRNGGELHLENPDANVQRLLEITGLNAYFDGHRRDDRNGT